MTAIARSAAGSHVGKIRANNQDSGYSGRQLFVVADGMGGHAGGDVASAIAVQRIREIDVPHDSADRAVDALRDALVAANGTLSEVVREHPELTGMGTTVSAMLVADGRMAIAHIGDSRIYRLRDGDLIQQTVDHTFVQRLVDSGRITPEEAAVHPRRSVLMRVLGDIEPDPEIDTAIVDLVPGDRWLLCSDGLSGYVSEEKVSAILGTARSPREATDRLIKEALDQGAPDNVTVLVFEVAEEAPEEPLGRATVGSAAKPLTFDVAPTKRPVRLPTLLLHPIKSVQQQEDSHFEPESDEYLDELIEEDRLRARRRRIGWLVGVSVVVLAIVAAGLLGYRWTQSRYFVGTDGSNVIIYQGVQQGIGPISLSSEYVDTGIRLNDLDAYTQQQLEGTISAGSLPGARAIVERIDPESDTQAGPQPVPSELIEPTPSPEVTP
ncbi:Stp1/IreP family PP2C-type Ser/Thr phosphatase [Arenivirga flava]|uniref:Serine/threonine protein phosphatase n=1 Tax=Arenivirga flava TaxID=1930060 RepID=A0AA37XBU0_9MICO|nr:Stp1/IreP family PP2C-type Ser/Thr phosphatase [Arenivirga flava]GMA29056.1 serine/threonine protein phosphatase [Arenivirga flava]